MARKQGPKGKQGPAEVSSPKPDQVTRKITLSRECDRLLRLEAFGQDCTVGQVVEQLLRSRPQRFVLVDRSRGIVAPPAPRDLPEERPEAPPGPPRPVVRLSDVG